jgi:hypothetical protein
MLRIRSASGDLIDLESKPYFVEICDSEGDIGMVFYQSEPNTVTQIEPKSEEANVYSAKYNVQFVKVIDLTKHHENVFQESGNS